MGAGPYPGGARLAAPMVTGALVVMKHYFRDQMSNTELVTRLLDTANDRGFYADSTIYGHGLLDLDAATRPVGTITLSLGNTLNGSGSPVTQTRLGLGNAFGNGLTRSFAGQEIAAFDALGAPFWYRLGGWHPNAGAEAGMTYARAGCGMLTGVSPLYSSAFALRAERALDADSTLQLSVSQPLRVESGRARFSIPVDRTKERRVLCRSLTASLAPDGRQIDVAARCRKRLSAGGELRLGAAWTLDPGHDAAAGSELTLLAGLRHGF